MPCPPGPCRGGFQVICDGIVGPWFIDVFRIAATARGIPLHYVILRPDQATALRRAVNRTDPALTDPEPIRSLHRQFTDIGGYEKHVLDSTRLSPQATADTVLHGLAGGTYHLIPTPESDSLPRRSPPTPSRACSRWRSGQRGR